MRCNFLSLGKTIHIEDNMVLILEIVSKFIIDKAADMMQTEEDEYIRAKIVSGSLGFYCVPNSFKLFLDHQTTPDYNNYDTKRWHSACSCAVY